MSTTSRGVTAVAPVEVSISFKGRQLSTYSELRGYIGDNYTDLIDKFDKHIASGDYDLVQLLAASLTNKPARVNEVMSEEQCSKYAAALLVYIREPMDPPTQEEPAFTKSQNAILTAFNDPYLDSDKCIEANLKALLENCEKYASPEGRTKYIAPYTSLVSPSLMGKTRFLKELSQRCPAFYVCTRNTPSDPRWGYPFPTPRFLHFLRMGVIEMTGVSRKRFIDDDHMSLCTYQWTTLILEMIRRVTRWIKNGEFFRCISENYSTNSPIQAGWIFRFFAQPPEDSTYLGKFWDDVINKTIEQVKSMGTGEAAYDYFVDDDSFANDVKKVMKSYQKCLRNHGFKDNLVPWLLVFDEASILACLESYDGSPVDDPKFLNTTTGLNTFSDSPCLYRSFCHLCSIRRALCYIALKCFNPGRRLFTILTDTVSRVADFQPNRWDEKSIRAGTIFGGGDAQFEPLFVFSSIDVFSRVFNQYLCTSNLKTIADPRRLARFGRAGWYAIAQGTKPFPSEHLVHLAQHKLICASPTENHPFIEDSAKISLVNKMKLLAILCSRLALTVSPSTKEGSELVASYLAILTRIDENRHFVATTYPSEPIIAEASARFTFLHGWEHPLKALLDMVQGGVVEAGFRGELLTKVVFIMAMDRALGTKRVTQQQWMFSRPITVSEFLNNLIASKKAPFTKTLVCRPKHLTATAIEELKRKQDAGLHVIDLDERELERFLNGYVFFNHFAQVEVKMTYAMLGQAWNRGAAIMCKTNTKAVDFVIPVMIDANIKFGPLHDVWEGAHINKARKHMSFILINARNYASGKDQTVAAQEAKLMSENLHEFGKKFSPKQTSRWDVVEEIMRKESEEESSQNVSELDTQNVFMSIVPDFGEKLKREDWISVGPSVALQNYGTRRSDYDKNGHRFQKQIYVVLKGSGDSTYACLKNRPKIKWRMEKVKDCIDELVQARKQYVEMGKYYTEFAMKNLPLIYGCSKMGGVAWSMDREKVQKALEIRKNKRFNEDSKSVVEIPRKKARVK